MAKRRSKHEVAMPGQCDSCPVRQRALFQPLRPHEIAAAQLYRVEARHLSPGDAVYRQGEPCSEIYTLYDGWAYLYQNLPDGRRQILNFLLPGDFFGFQADVGEGIRVHSAQAVTAASLCVFPRSNLLKMFREHPSLGIRLTWMTARDEAIAHEHLASLGRRSARERIAYLLLEIFNRARARQSDAEVTDTIDMPLTQELIADASGLTPIHVSRTLKSLCQDRLLQLKEGQLWVPDPELLAKVANYGHNGLLQRPIL